MSEQTDPRDAEITAPRCEQRGCTAAATHDVFWPSRTTRQCAEHARQLLALAGSMGCWVDVRALEDGDE